MASEIATNPVVTPTVVNKAGSATDVAAKGGDPMLVSITEAMIAAHPELAKVRDLYLSGEYAAATNTLYGTDFYANTSPVMFSNENVKINQPKVYERTIQTDWLPSLRQEALAKGLVITDANLTAIAQKAYDLGLTPASPATLELFRGIDSTGKPYVTTIQGGIASTAKQNIATTNADYSGNFNQDWVSQAAQSVAEGTTTEQYWTDQIKANAKGSFPAWSSQIDAGLTMKQIASPYITAYSQILGVDPASVTLGDKLLKQGLQGNDPTQPAGMPLWEFEKQVRKDPRWATSKDAMDNLSNVGSTILRQWGLMS